jgi:group I intron endonuclease
MSIQQYPSTQGIYKITNTTNNKFYIGSSKQLNKRIIDHFSRLRNNTHKNKFLQRAFNKYGESSFKIEILEQFVGLTQEELLTKEQHHLDLIENWRESYNQTRSTKYFGKILPEEYERKQNKIASVTGENNPFYGKTHTERVRKILSESNFKSGSNVTKKKDGTFEVKIKRSIYIGSFKTYEEALNYRLLAERYYYDNDESVKPLLDAVKRVRDLPRGVLFRDGKYVAKITWNKRQYQLGTFNTPEKASQVYQNAEKYINEGCEEFSYLLTIKQPHPYPTGVCLKSNGRFSVTIVVNSKQLRVGSSTLEEAVDIRKKAEDYYYNNDQTFAAMFNKPKKELPKGIREVRGSYTADFNKKRLGTFKTIQEAIAARLAAEQSLLS